MEGLYRLWRPRYRTCQPPPNTRFTRWAARRSGLRQYRTRG